MAMTSRVEQVVMNNPRLDRFSAAYADPTGDLIEQRCFFLFAGTDVDKGAAFSVSTQVLKFDDPNMPVNLNCNIKVDNFMIEECSDAIFSLTQMIPDFKTVLRFDDLYPKPASLNLERYIKNRAPLLYLKNEIIRHGKYTDA